MKLYYKMESVLIILISVLCGILLFKLLFKLRSSLPWRVNCWFCNNNFWVKYPERNCWTCQKCEQYNGFTKDGDYNKSVLVSNEQSFKSPKVFQSSPPKNGLCKMCNINQQLKVTQLANFVPMHETYYDEEIEPYKLHLEKAYKLCSPCKKVLQMKLHKEKETLLGTKLLETRTPEKKNQKQEILNNKLKSFINNSSMGIAVILLTIVSVECYKNIMKHKNLSSSIIKTTEILTSLIDRIISIIKMKTLMTFPSLEYYLNDVNNLYLDTSMIPNILHLKDKSLDDLNLLSQMALGGFVCLIQIIGHVWNVNKLKHTLLIDLLWSVFVMTSIGNNHVAIDLTIMSFIKLSSVLLVLIVYKTIKTQAVRPVVMAPLTPPRMMNFNKTMQSMMEEDVTALETDDDVSLSKFGLHNITNSSTDTNTHNNNNNIINDRSFTPRSNDSLWSKPKLNSTFCVNTVLCKSPSSVSDTVFIKPDFNKYQNLTKDDSDSELDESISSLCISSPKKNSKSGNSVFSLRKFTATPSFVAPTPLTRARPLISPSKLGHSTSWVAGGYWGAEGERQLFNMNGSRSSSQSSGFESQASSACQRNVFSQPPSREESVCGEPDRSAMLDRFQNNCSVNGCGYQQQYGNYKQPQNFGRVSSPVFPQMQYNGHVHIPRARHARCNVVPNVFAQHQYAQNNMFKAPAASGLIRLPQVNSFTSH